MPATMPRVPRPVGLAALALGLLGLSAAASGASAFSAPRARQVLVAGARVDVRWEAPCGEPGRTESEVLLSLDGGATFPIRLTPELPACAGGFRWEIPATPSAHARLALRTGLGDEEGDEALELVSDEFTIAVVGRAPEEDPLVSGPRERWTRQALSGEIGAPLPAPSMEARERLVKCALETDLEPPPTPGGLPSPGARDFATTPVRADAASVAARAASRSPVTAPLRL